MLVLGKVLELVLGRLWALQEGRAGRWARRGWEQPDPTEQRKDVVSYALQKG